jgi:hypothetical protein
MITMPLFGKKSCGHTGRAPWGTVRCAKAPDHRGDHGARGLKWGADGKVKVGGRKATR